MSSRLLDLHKQALDSFKDTPHAGHFNWQLKFSCEVSELEKLIITDVADIATLWRKNPCPDQLYFSHGQYLGPDGLNNLIAELKLKPSSNRALYSLISQHDIVNSGDAPIPSFMVFQCAIVGETLICSSYFRALEISKFLRINLEEIRQNLMFICSSITFLRRIEFSIFAFRAYVDVNASVLMRPDIELLKDDRLQRRLMDDAADPVSDLERLLRQLHNAVTVVSTEKLESL
jgi:hypothetical protein